MEPKIILVPFGGNDHETAALETAFDLAKKWNAHVDVWHILPDPEALITSIATFGMGPQYFPDESTFSELLKINEKNKKDVKLKFLKALKKFDINHTDDPSLMKEASATLHTSIGNAEKILFLRARLADLIIMSRNSETNLLSNEIINAIIFDTGRPILLIPPGESAKPFNGNTIIAWNGSREAVHAVTAAFPFLTQGKVWVITGESDHWDESPLLPQELAAYLKHHGIRSEALTPWINGTGVPELILKSAKKLDADLIVMGAYSHSRIREMILGGVTEHMLKHADVPVLMMH